MSNWLSRHTAAAFVVGFTAGPVTVVEGYGHYTMYQVQKQQEAALRADTRKVADNQAEKSSKIQDYERWRREVEEAKKAAEAASPKEAPPSPVLPSTGTGTP